MYLVLLHKILTSISEEIAALIGDSNCKN